MLSKVIIRSLFKANVRRFSALIAESHEYVPKHQKATNHEIKVLQQFIDGLNKVLVLTGAGISTESGIPDYRSEGVGLYDRRGHKPVQYQDFLKSETIRRRYWARNYCGWNHFSSIQPNVSHKCLTDWERHQKVHYVVTQNVDRLHQKAGTDNVIELHGSGYTVKCLSCKYSVSRYLFQKTLTELNEEILSNDIIIQNNQMRPDGDIDINSEFVENFQYPSCPRCDGILKPDIIFFGDNVPKDRVNSVYQSLNESDGLLVIGSSLQVYSGYRFVMTALEDKKPIAVLNIGPTRIDRFDQIIRLTARAGDILPQILIQHSI